jgi:hypothetical protein
MKLYRARIPAVARTVIEALTRDGDIEVTSENRAEAEQDLVSIMEEYLRRDYQLRDTVKERMERMGIGYDRYGKLRNQLAEEWGHPTGDEVERYLARQFVENFMISRFIEEVYTEDGMLWRKTLGLVKSQDVDERALRDEARARIKNVDEGTVEYEVAFERALREVRRQHGL